MIQRKEKEFWIEMSIREITTQAHFADIAFKNISSKAMFNTDVTFSSIHSFLSHCAIISKMLKADDGEIPPKSIGDILGVPGSSIVHERKFRNCLEHYDKELRLWIKKVGANANIATYNLGPKAMIQGPNMVFVSHYDPGTKIFTFVNEDFDINKMHNEVMRIKKLADIRVSTNTGKMN